MSATARQHASVTLRYATRRHDIIRSARQHGRDIAASAPLFYRAPVACSCHDVVFGNACAASIAHKVARMAIAPLNVAAPKMPYVCRMRVTRCCMPARQAPRKSRHDYERHEGTPLPAHTARYGVSRAFANDDARYARAIAMLMRRRRCARFVVIAVATHTATRAQRSARLLPLSPRRTLLARRVPRRDDERYIYGEYQNI